MVTASAAPEIRLTDYDSCQGRLHPDIREPTASELTHHLCPPLAFLVDACQDLFDEQVSGDTRQLHTLAGAQVQTEVATPFLTQKAIDLLKASLSTRSES